MRLLNVIADLFKPGNADFVESHPAPQPPVVITRNTRQEYLQVGDLYIDKRHIEGIDLAHYYTPEEAANLLGVHRNTIYKLCAEPSQESPVDTRHFIGINQDAKYYYHTIATHFNVSASLIRSMARTGVLDRIAIGNTFRIPGWSIYDLIRNNAASLPGPTKIDNLQISTLIRIPGWCLKDYMLCGCTRL